MFPQDSKFSSEKSVMAEVVAAEVAMIVFNVVAMVDQTQGSSVGWLLPQGKLNFVGQRELPSWVLKKVAFDL